MLAPRGRNQPICWWQDYASDPDPILQGMNENDVDISWTCERTPYVMANGKMCSMIIPGEPGDTSKPGFMAVDILSSFMRHIDYVFRDNSFFWALHKSGHKVCVCVLLVWVLLVTTM